MTLNMFVRRMRLITEHLTPGVRATVNDILDEVEKQPIFTLSDEECKALRGELSHYFIPYTDEGNIVAHLWKRLDAYVEKLNGQG